MTIAFPKPDEGVIADRPFRAGGPEPADAGARRVRSGLTAQPRQSVPARGTAGGLEACVILAWSQARHLDIDPGFWRVDPGLDPGIVWDDERHQ